MVEDWKKACGLVIIPIFLMVFFWYITLIGEPANIARATCQSMYGDNTFARYPLNYMLSPFIEVEYTCVKTIYSYEEVDGKIVAFSKEVELGKVTVR